MALTDVGAMMFPQSWYSVSFTATVLDADGEKAAAILQVPKSGSVTHIGFLTGTVTAEDTLAVRLETVDAATGAPTGTAYGGCVAGAQATPAAGTFYEVALATPATVVAGDAVAVVVYIPTYGDANLQIRIGAVGSAFGLPYCAAYAAGAWTKNTSAPITVLRYSDGSYAYSPGVLPGVIASIQYKQDTTPYDEYGLAFVAPCNMRVSGWWGYILPGAASEIVLYSGTTQLAAATLDNDVTQASGAGNQMLGQFPVSVDLVAGQQYRLTLRPSDGVANSNLYYLVTPSAAAMAAMPMGTDAIGTSRLNLGAWTDLPTYRPQIGVVASHVDDDVIVISPDRITHNPTIWDPTSNLFWNPFKKLWTLR